MEARPFEGLKTTTIFKRVFAWAKMLLATKPVNYHDYYRQPFRRDEAARWHGKIYPPTRAGCIYIKPLCSLTRAEVGIKPAENYCFSSSWSCCKVDFNHLRHHAKFTVVPITRNRYVHMPLRYECALFWKKIRERVYYDAKEKKYVDECGATTSSPSRQYIRYAKISTSILQYYRWCLMQLARVLGDGIFPGRLRFGGARRLRDCISYLGDNMENSSATPFSADGKPDVCPPLRPVAHTM